MERKLASVQQVLEVIPIEGADSIEQIKILGWSLVSKKNELKAGDLAVFFEIDSVLPEREWSEFMRPSKFRVKTKKMRGCLSQGLVLPFKALALDQTNYEIGQDLTDELGVTKFELPAALGLDIEGSFPHFIPKTDEIRIQSVPEVLEEMKGLPYYIATKLDGTSATYAKYEGKFYQCSRNYAMKPNCKYYGQIAEKYDLENLVPEGYAIQGEIVGSNLQKNRLNLKELDFFVFNVFHIPTQTYRNIEFMQGVCDQLGLLTVPYLIASEPFGDFTVEDLLEAAKGYYAGTSNHREGLVIRPVKEAYSKALKGRLSFKVINNDFLLKGGED